MEKIVTDQMNRMIRLEKIPERIISLVPSQTELLVDLGLEEKLVGITKFCIHPDHIFRNKTRIGGTKKFDFNKIRELKPDLIIGNKEENEKSQIDLLAKEFPVWMSDIFCLEDTFEMFRQIGMMTGSISRAEELVKNIRSGFNSLKCEFQFNRVLYLIWKEPWMAAGKKTFIDEIMSLAGFNNIISESRYPELTSEQIKTMNPEIIFLSSEPYPFKENHIVELNVICPQSKIILVDGELFSWYGSRLLKTPEYLAELIRHLRHNE
jgi:ABC-type Fe3+-hydroxamate transport system substrate-binding protein